MVFESAEHFSYFFWYSLKMNLLFCGFGFGFCTFCSTDGRHTVTVNCVCNWKELKIL